MSLFQTNNFAPGQVNWWVSDDVNDRPKIVSFERKFKQVNGHFEKNSRFEKVETGNFGNESSGLVCKIWSEKQVGTIIQTRYFRFKLFFECFEGIKVKFTRVDISRIVFLY